MNAVPLQRLVITSLSALLLGGVTSDAAPSAPLLRYEFKEPGEVQQSTGAESLDLTLYAGNGVVPEDRIRTVAAASPGNGAEMALDLRYLGSHRVKGAAVASLSHNAPLADGLSSFAISAWIYGHQAHSDGGVRRVVRLSSGSKAVIDFRLGKADRGSDGVLSIALNGEEALVTAPVSSGVFVPSREHGWHFIAVSYEAATGTLELYSGQEGGPLKSYSQVLDSPLEPIPGATSLSIGNAGRGHDRQLDAYLSDVRFYNSALTQGEMEELFSSSTGSGVSMAGGALLLGALLLPFVRVRRALSITLLLHSALPVMALDVVSNGEAKAVIVIPDRAPEVVQQAARELAHYLKEATTAELSIQRESELPAPPAHAIYLGQTKAFTAAGFLTKELKKNAFARVSTEQALYLAGGDDANWKSPVDGRLGMGTMLAVYDFLDRDLGVRWLWPGEFGTRVPKQKTLEVPPEALKVVEPRFLFTRLRYNKMHHRIADWKNGKEFAENAHAMVNEWMRRHRVLRTLDIETGHGYGKYWSRFGKTNPEFFALRPDGKRGPIDKREYLVQMCVSNPDLWKVIVDDWRRDDPRHPWIVGFENDRRVIDPVCTCAGCRSWDIPAAKVSVPDNPWHIDSRSPDEVDPYESVSLSNRYARFYLELQKEGQKYDPFAKVVGYAYSNYSDPPVDIRLNPNIIISVVPPYIYPFPEGKEAQFRELWDRWRATGATLYYRPNHTLVGYCMPYIYSTQLGNDLKHAIDHGMVGSIFDSLLGMWGVHGPDLYLLGRIHARPEMEPEAILDEYYTSFGPAEKEVRDYFGYWEEITKRCNDAFRRDVNGGWALISKGGHLIYTPAVMDHGAALLKKAEAKAKDNPEIAGRVHYLSVWLQNARLSIDLMRMARIFEAGGETDEEKVARLAAKDELRKFRHDHQHLLIGGNWDRLGPYEPWNRWEN